MYKRQGKPHRDTTYLANGQTGFGETDAFGKDALYITGSFSGRHAVWRSIPTDRGRRAMVQDVGDQSVVSVCGGKPKHVCELFKFADFLLCFSGIVVFRRIMRSWAAGFCFDTVYPWIGDRQLYGVLLFLSLIHI